LVDKLGGLEDAISLAGQMAGLGDDPRIVKEYPRRRTILDYLAEQVSELVGVNMPKNTWPSWKYIYK
jgi:ClpP class serine protease